MSNHLKGINKVKPFHFGVIPCNCLFININKSLFNLFCYSDDWFLAIRRFNFIASILGSFLFFNGYHFCRDLELLAKHHPFIQWHCLINLTLIFKQSAFNWAEVILLTEMLKNCSYLLIRRPFLFYLLLELFYISFFVIIYTPFNVDTLSKTKGKLGSCKLFLVLINTFTIMVLVSQIKD